MFNMSVKELLIATGVYAAIVGVTVILVALIGLLVIDADPKIISIIISGISVISPLIFGVFLFLRGKKDVDKID